MIIKSAKKINDTISKISSTIEIDVYYLSKYVEFYKKKDNEYNAFFLEKGRDFFFIPYIKKLIHHKEELYDIETPYGYGGPIVNSSDKLFIKMAWEKFFLAAKKDNIIAGLFRFNPFYEISKFEGLKNLNLVKEREIVILDLNKSEEEIFNNFSKDNKNKIKKAYKSNLIFEVCNSIEQLNDFSKIYISRMKQKSALEMYLFSKKYFKKVLDSKNEFVKIYILKKQNEVIGGAIILKNKIYAHYHISSCKKEYFNLGPNNFLRHNVIKDLKKNKLRIINFGGGLTSDPEDTLFNFKKKFSKDTKWFFIGKCVFDFNKYKNIVKEWSLKNPDKELKYSNYILKYRF